ncbi:four helix bundle protein [Candidatus Microgenomates bacterium]|jgi:four helix bundle protein|nr:MAG: four helix bundle protein [Candidatus Microgenomates bacterium]
MTQFTNKYNLEERTAKFGESIINFCRNLSQDNISSPLINQVVRSSTSVGANYKDFENKIFICKKESQETKHWLRMLANCFPDRKEEIRKLWTEAQELTMIFQKITSSLNK